MKIVEVAPEFRADEQGLKAGDVILEVAGNEVNGPADVKDALEGRRASHGC